MGTLILGIENIHPKANSDCDQLHLNEDSGLQISIIFGNYRPAQVRRFLNEMRNATERCVRWNELRKETPDGSPD